MSPEWKAVIGWRVMRRSRLDSERQNIIFFGVESFLSFTDALSRILHRNAEGRLLSAPMMKLKSIP